MGLFGLSLFNAVRRTKEIGIRKVLGATWREILAVLIKGFVKLVLIASAVLVSAWHSIRAALSDPVRALRHE